MQYYYIVGSRIFFLSKRTKLQLLLYSYETIPEIDFLAPWEMSYVCQLVNWKKTDVMFKSTKSHFNTMLVNENKNDSAQMQNENCPVTTNSRWQTKVRWRKNGRLICAIFETFTQASGQAIQLKFCAKNWISKLFGVNGWSLRIRIKWKIVMRCSDCVSNCRKMSCSINLAHQTLWISGNVSSPAENWPGKNNHNHVKWVVASIFHPLCLFFYLYLMTHSSDTLNGTNRRQTHWSHFSTHEHK